MDILCRHRHGLQCSASPASCGRDTKRSKLALAQELVGYADAFACRPPGFCRKSRIEAFQFAHLIEGVGNLFFRGLVESGDVQIADSGLMRKCRSTL